MGRQGLIDITGMRYGRLTVVGFDRTENHLTYWRVRCDCGVEFTVYRGNLVRGLTRSCGCYRADRLKGRAAL